MFDCFMDMKTEADPVTLSVKSVGLAGKVRKSHLYALHLMYITLAI